MHVYFTPRARAALLRIAQRWKEKARHPEVFEHDIVLAIQRLATSPTSGFRARTSNRRVVFRIGTEKTQLHLYYVVDVTRSVVTVLQVWGRRRGIPPPL
jgi:hypothetical protein